MSQLVNVTLGVLLVVAAGSTLMILHNTDCQCTALNLAIWIKRLISCHFQPNVRISIRTKTWQTEGTSACSCHTGVTALDRDNRTAIIVWAWAFYQIHKITGCLCAGNAGNVSPITDVIGNRGLAIPAYITARVWRTRRGACRDR